MKNRRNSAVKVWAKENLHFLQEAKALDFFTTFVAKTPITITDNVGMRIMGGIWFEGQVLNYFRQQGAVFVFTSQMAKSNANTKKILDHQHYRFFHQPWFRINDVITQCDFLGRNGDGFDLYEVKGVNETETAAKQREYFTDLVYQVWVLTQCQIKVKNVFLVHLNRDYVHQTKLDLPTLITINSTFNNELTKQFPVADFLPQIIQYLARPFAEVQAYLLDLACQETKFNYKKATFIPANLCSMVVPKLKFEHHILHFYRLFSTRKVQLYQHLIAQNLPGSLNLETLKLQDLGKFTTKFKPPHWRQLAVIQNQAPLIANYAKAVKELEQYQYPLYFYDFETSATPLPLFANSRPYQQIPFQFSIHVFAHPHQKRSDLRNICFIAANRTDPRLEFLNALLKGLDNVETGSYVAYHKTFELMILKALQRDLAPLLTTKQQHQLERLIARTLDLKAFFTDLNIYLPNFYGSLSIKKTLPAFAPDFSYDHLTIQKGDQASALYFSFLYQLIDDQTWLAQRENLNTYCQQDTLAMVVIFIHLCRLLKVKA